eukprot:TRINITY_DN20817_c2_g1_i1.p1 TRINITY_DN20817_c2_g1~~TRINITY_DN20817_c2_g1_i1.p1  ORF type:complete len:132 (+),score=15.73 TRINITY_DN20817_c2_g1_i1:99-494(+)
MSMPILLASVDRGRTDHMRWASTRSDAPHGKCCFCESWGILKDLNETWKCENISTLGHVWQWSLPRICIDFSCLRGNPTFGGLQKMELMLTIRQTLPHRTPRGHKMREGAAMLLWVAALGSLVFSFFILFL